MKGITEILKDSKVFESYKDMFTLEDLEKSFLKKINSRQKKYYTPHKLTWEEARAFTDFTKEEYENSTGLYILPNGSLTGKGGWDLFLNELKRLENINK